MANKRKSRFRGLAEPVRVREPLPVRLCVGLVENLTLILRTALVLGAVALVHDLRILFDDMSQPVAETAAEIDAAPTVIDENEGMGAPEAQEPVLSEGVLHALNCTYKVYRDTHYDECTEDSSDIYQRPDADPDNTGYINSYAPELYARLDDYTSLLETIENRWVP
jgi:hypothetical protein